MLSELQPEASRSSLLAILKQLPPDAIFLVHTE